MPIYSSYSGDLYTDKPLSDETFDAIKQWISRTPQCHWVVEAWGGVHTFSCVENTEGEDDLPMLQKLIDIFLKGRYTLEGEIECETSEAGHDDTEIIYVENDTAKIK